MGNVHALRLQSSHPSSSSLRAPPGFTGGPHICVPWPHARLCRGGGGQGPCVGGIGGGWQPLPLPCQFCPLPGAVAWRQRRGVRPPSVPTPDGQTSSEEGPQPLGPSAHTHACWLQTVRLRLGGTHVLLPARCRNGTGAGDSETTQCGRSRVSILWDFSFFLNEALQSRAALVAAVWARVCHGGWLVRPHHPLSLPQQGLCRGSLVSGVGRGAAAWCRGLSPTGALGVLLPAPGP